MKAIAIIVMHDMFLASNKGLLLWRTKHQSNNKIVTILLTIF